MADFDQPLVLPFLERKLPGQGEQAGGHVRGRSEHVAHGISLHDKVALAGPIRSSICIVVGLWRCRPGRPKAAMGSQRWLVVPFVLTLAVLLVDASMHARSTKPEATLEQPGLGRQGPA